MPSVTSIQRRRPRENQWQKYANYDEHYFVDRLEVALDPKGETLTLYFRKSGDASLGLGLRIPRGWAGMIASTVEAVDRGAGKLRIDLE